MSGQTLLIIRFVQCRILVKETGMKTYEYEELKDEKVFQEFLEEVGKVRRGRRFTDSIDIDDFIERIEMECFIYGGQVLYRGKECSDKEVYKALGDPADVDSYLEYELQSPVYIRIYGRETLKGYDKEGETYCTSLFNEYTRIMIG